MTSPTFAQPSPHPFPPNSPSQNIALPARCPQRYKNNYAKTPTPRKRERAETLKTKETNKQEPPPTKAHKNEAEEEEIVRAIALSLKEEAITKKRQSKKRVNAETHDPTQNYLNKGPPN